MKIQEALKLVWKAPDSECKFVLALITEHIYAQGEIDQETTEDLLEILRPEPEEKGGEE